MNVAVVEIHGIRQKKTETSWPFLHELDARTNIQGTANLFCLNESYEAGLIPIVNHRLINPKEVGSLLWKIVELRETFPGIQLNFIAHSNGTNIAAHLMLALADRGIYTERAVLIGSAMQSDIVKSGIAELISKKYLRQAIAYVSEKDAVVSRLDGIPGMYGSLGSKGFHYKGKPVGPRTDNQSVMLIDRIATRVFPDYGHSTYFDPDHIKSTFDIANRDLRLETQLIEQEKRKSA